MKDKESLETGALVGKLPDPVQNQVNSVVTPNVVVGRVLLAGDELLGVEQLPVGPGPHLVNHGELEVHKPGPGHMLPRPRLGEGIEGVIASHNGLAAGHGAVRLDSVLEALQLPACFMLAKVTFMLAITFF